MHKLWNSFYIAIKILILGYKVNLLVLGRAYNITELSKRDRFLKTNSFLSYYYAQNLEINQINVSISREYLNKFKLNWLKYLF